MVSAISGTGSSPLIPATDFSERALCKKWKLCSLPSVLRADCHSRALRAGYLGGWLAGWLQGNRFGRHVPRASEAREASREAVGLQRRSPGHGRRSLWTRSWARARPDHHTRALGAARGQLGVPESWQGRHLCLEHMPAVKKSNERARPLSSYH